MWDAGCGELRPLPKFNFFCFLFSVILTLSNGRKKLLLTHGLLPRKKERIL